MNTKAILTSLSISVLLISFVAPNFVFASSSDSWIQTYKVTGEVSVEDIIQTSDGGYAIAGNLFIKTNAYGNVEWNQTYSARSLIPTSDGGFALAGGLQLLKTDPCGNLEWNRTLWGGRDGSTAFSLIPTDDGGYAIAGITGDPRWTEEHFWLTKVDELGLAKWTITYDNVMAGAAHSVIQTLDGGYAILGSNSNNPDFLLVKTNSSGGLEWSKTYGSQVMDFGADIVQNKDGGYVLGGFM
jgi:hypothetical protein